MYFDEHMDVLLHCLIYAKTTSFDACIGVSRIHELEESLHYALPDTNDALIQEYGSLTDYFLKIQAQGSAIYDKFFDWAHEGFQVMSQYDYYNDSRQFAPLCYNYVNEKESFVFIVLPYNKNRILQELRQEKKKERREKREAEKELVTPVTPQDLDLEKEVVALFKENALKGDALEKRLDLKKRVNDMINKEWPDQGYKVVIFGSSANGLGVDEGDLDLCITGPGQTPKRRDRRFRMDIEDVYNMEYLATLLSRIGMKNIRAVNNAHVPIVKFVDPKTDLKVDINANSKLGIENTRLIKQYTRLDSRVGPFLFAIKYFANKKKINDCPGGTISSYAYYLLGLHYLMSVLTNPVIPSLQHLRIKCEDPLHCNYKSASRIEGYDVRYHDCVEIITKSKYELRNPDKRFDGYSLWYGKNTDNLGTLIRDFFRWCADITILTQPKSIITDDGIPWNMDERKWWVDTLVIQDPFVFTKNIAHPCTERGLQDITEDFQEASDKFDLQGATFEQVCNSEYIEQGTSFSAYTYEILV